MDAATFFMIVTLLDGTPRTWQRPTTVEACDRYMRFTRLADSKALAWCSPTRSDRPLIIAR